MTVRWGILGASNFARQHMGPAIHAAKGADLVALATSSAEKAAGFLTFCPTLAVHPIYDALLADPGVEAVYIPLPNHLHIEWVNKALDAGKHVLCEKPLAMQAADIPALMARRDQTGLLVAEAFMIVHHAQWQWVREQVAGGAIGNRVSGGGTRTYEGTETRCQNNNTVSEARHVVGYNVEYRYRGDVYVSRLDYDPGDRLRIRISVSPVD